MEVENHDEIASVAVSRKTLRQIPDSETFRRVDEIVSAGVVRCTFGVRQSKDSPQYEKSVLFDYSNCSFDEVCLLSATNGVVVWAQRVLRDMGENMLNSDNLATVDVKEHIIEGGIRVTGDPVDRAKRAVNRLTLEQKTALIEEWLSGN